eukprot:COSAG06_NODE_17123_length_960_cov_0.657375_1_plen_243_part_10
MNGTPAPVPPRLKKRRQKDAAEPKMGDAAVATADAAAAVDGEKSAAVAATAEKRLADETEATRAAKDDEAKLAIAAVPASASADADVDEGAVRKTEEQVDVEPKIASARCTPEKVALIFARYDTDHDGVLQHADVARLEKEVADEDIDAESWEALCELVGASGGGIGGAAASSGGIGWGVEELGRLYAMEGGEQELEKAWHFVSISLEQGQGQEGSGAGGCGTEAGADAIAPEPVSAAPEAEM